MQDINANGGCVEARSNSPKNYKSELLYKIDFIRSYINKTLIMNKTADEVFTEISRGIETFVEYQTQSSLHSASTEEELMNTINNMNMLKCIEDEYIITLLKNTLETHFLNFDKFIENINRILPLYNSLKTYYSSLIIQDDEFKPSEKVDINTDDISDEHEIIKVFSGMNIPDNADAYGFDVLNKG